MWLKKKKIYLALDNILPLTIRHLTFCVWLDIKGFPDPSDGFNFNRRLSNDLEISSFFFQYNVQGIYKILTIHFTQIMTTCFKIVHNLFVKDYILMAVDLQ